MQHPSSLISVVLPVYNEEKNIGPLVAGIVDVFSSQIRQPIEIIVVDDASSDGSRDMAFLVASTFAAKESMVKVKVISCQVRSGQSAALMRGMESAEGSIIVTMDADGQHDPADISLLLAALDARDMVCGVRNERLDGSARALCSRIANGFRNWITGDTTTDSGCTFRAMRRECLPFLLPLKGRLYGCEFFFHPFALRKAGFRVTECIVHHKKRIYGGSKYKLIRGRFIRGVLACFVVKRILD